jgi:Ankyrin repeats (many copies)
VPQHRADCRDPHGNTPLHLAVMLGRMECVQLLLVHGAPVKVKNKAGWSPLAEAIRYEYTIVLEPGPEPHHFGRAVTPLAEAIRYEDQ